MRTIAAVNDRNFKISHSITRVNSTFNFHAHDWYEIYFFESGEIQYYIEDQTFLMVAGDMLVIPPGKMHRIVTVNESVTYSRMVVDLSEEYVKRLMRVVGGHFVFRGVTHYHFSTGDEESRIKDLLSSFLTMEADEAGVLSRDATVTLLLIHLDRLMKQAPVREAKEHQLAQVIRYINANYTRDVTLEEIADRFFISKYHLLRRFKALTNSTVHQYILTKRILLARTLLRQGIAPAEVATQCGFSSYAGFYQAFTAQTGISPSAFQKE